MKKSFLIFLITLIGLSKVYAGTPPKLVSKALTQKFPSAVNINWVKESYDLWVASFNLKDKRATATFTSDGHWMQSTLEIAPSELREEVKSAVKNDFTGCEIISILVKEFLLSGTWYEVKVKCGNKIIISSYDSNGWPPPKI